MIVLSPEQEIALDNLVDFAIGEGTGMMTLEGYAGTGKTTLVGSLCNVLKNKDGEFKMAIAAPTNKATHVLREKLKSFDVNEEYTPEQRHGYEQKHWMLRIDTIHALLGLKLQENEDGTQECGQNAESKSTLHEYDLVIIDECSMINNKMFELIITMKRHALILFVGDPAQLPPIGDNAISSTFSKVVLKSTLNNIVRQALDNPIIGLSLTIRQFIERNERISGMAIGEVLPKTRPTKAGLMSCQRATIVKCVVADVKNNLDTRVIAFTNTSVLQYNREIHALLHGNDATFFVAGERVVVHQQTEAMKDGLFPTRLFTSEELTVKSVKHESHPYYLDIPAYKLELERENQGTVACYYPHDMDAIQRQISEYFAQWRHYKSLRLLGDDRENKDTAKMYSGKAWSLRKAFAPLRHAYAITTHKSQGSTFHTVFVDYNDLCKIKNAFDFNRALYVAITRPSENLAILV